MFAALPGAKGLIADRGNVYNVAAGHLGNVGYETELVSRDRSWFP
jgi:hypothetical protein